jgi:hypothetical protein
MTRQSTRGLGSVEDTTGTGDKGTNAASVNTVAKCFGLPAAYAPGQDSTNAKGRPPGRPLCPQSGLPFPEPLGQCRSVRPSRTFAATVTETSPHRRGNALGPPAHLNARWAPSTQRTQAAADTIPITREPRFGTPRRDERVLPSSRLGRGVHPRGGRVRRAPDPELGPRRAVSRQRKRRAARRQESNRPGASTTGTSACRTGPLTAPPTR